jgi:hypothetical protein
MSSSLPRPRAGQATAAAIDPAELAQANINPATGLANDYLNHFNEAIMTLDMLAIVPEGVEDLLAWRPMTYREHFEASKLKHRALAISAYDTAEHDARRKLNQLAAAMNGGLVAIREALRANPSPPATAAMAQQAAAELKRLVARASAVINGNQATPESVPGNDAQAEIDALLDR